MYFNFQFENFLYEDFIDELNLKVGKKIKMNLKSNKNCK